MVMQKRVEMEMSYIFFKSISEESIFSFPFTDWFLTKPNICIWRWINGFLISLFHFFKQIVGNVERDCGKSLFSCRHAGKLCPKLQVTVEETFDRYKVSCFFLSSRFNDTRGWPAGFTIHSHIYVFSCDLDTFFPPRVCRWRLYELP